MSKPHLLERKAGLYYVTLSIQLHAHNMFWQIPWYIPGLIRWTRVTWRWGLLFYAKKKGSQPLPHSGVVVSLNAVVALIFEMLLHQW